MVPKIRSIIFIALAAVALLLLYFSLVYHWVTFSTADSQLYQSSVFQTESSYVQNYSTVISELSQSREVVALGASNARFDFRPAAMQQNLPGYLINNLSMGGASIYTVSHTIDLIYEQTPMQNRKNLVFVVGGWFGLMMTTDHTTPFQSELAETNKMLLSVQHAVSALLPWLPEYLPIPRKVFLMIHWGRMVPNAIYQQLYRFIADTMGIKVFPSNVQQRAILSFDHYDNVPTSLEGFEEEKKILIARYRNKWTNDAFSELVAINEKVKSGGGHLVYVNLPVVGSIRQMDEYAWYLENLNKYITRSNDGEVVNFIDLGGAFEDDAFFDWGHLRPAFANEFSKLVGKNMQQYTSVM